MATARNHHLFLNEPTYYHLMNRCVRRAFLCGVDHYTKKCYDHRKVWMDKRIHELSELFFIDLYAYAVMSNHYHMIVQTRPDEMRSASDTEIARRWCRVFPHEDENNDQRINNLVKQPEKIAEYRNRLLDISWLMRCINESIARRANKEDNVTGRFWQGRFKSQLLLDEPAVLACMAYVDLNPVRAGIAEDLESSRFTSIHERLNNHDVDQPLIPISHCYKSDINAPDILLSHYILFVEELMVESQKKVLLRNRSRLDELLSSINLNPSGLRYLVKGFTQSFSRAIGTVGEIEILSEKLNQRWVKGVKMAKLLFE